MILCVCVCVCVCARSVMSNSLQPHGLQAARLLCPWNFPSKNTGEDWQRIFCTRASSRHRDQTRVSCVLCLLRWQVNSLPLSHAGSPPKVIKKEKQKNRQQKCDTQVNPSPNLYNCIIQWNVIYLPLKWLWFSTTPNFGHRCWIFMAGSLRK